MGNQGSSYEWNQSNVQNVPGSQPLSIDTGLSNTRSVPTTPASTPPGSVQQGMGYQTAQSYDSSRPMYSAPPSQPTQYNTQPQQMMGYPKTEMAPPARAPDQGDVKPAEGMMPQGDDQVNHANAGDENDHDHEYTHTNAPYNGNRAPYAYNASAAPGQIAGEHPHLSPEMTGSPHQNGSGRATPRTTTTGQTQWNSGYPTPQRSAPSSNLYSVMSSDPRATNGNAPPDSYQPPGAVPQYPSQAYASNGIGAPQKRGREDDDQDPYGRPGSVQGDDIDGLKRRKTMDGGAVGGSPYSQDPNAGLQRARTTMTQRRR